MPLLTRLPIVVVASVWLIGGGSHVPPFQPTFASLVFDFFLAHPKP
jgi:hypothetical protein